MTDSIKGTTTISFDGDDSTVESTESPGAQEGPKEFDNATSPTLQWSKTNGYFFAYASLSYVCFTIIAVTVQAVYYMAGHGWRKNPIYAESENDEQHLENAAKINVHAWLGVLVSLMLFFQVVSAICIHLTKGDPKRREHLKTAHRWIGRLTATMLLATMGAGVIVVFRVTMTSSSQPVVLLVTSNFAIAFYAFVNLVLAVWAVIGSKRDLFVHKAGMFFVMKYLLTTSALQAIAMVVQVLNPGCRVKELGGALLAAIIELLQLIGFVAAAFWFDRIIFKSRLVFINLLVWVFVLLALFAVALSFIAERANLPADECFAHW